MSFEAMLELKGQSNELLSRVREEESKLCLAVRRFANSGC